MSQRMDYNAASPAGMKALGAVYAYVRQSGLPSRLIDLVFLRVSQINGCAYCIDMHSRDLLKAGLPVEHLVLLAAWPEARQHLRRAGKGSARVGGSRDTPRRPGCAGQRVRGGGRGVWREAARRPDDRDRPDERLQPNGDQLPCDAHGARRLITSAGTLHHVKDEGGLHENDSNHGGSGADRRKQFGAARGAVRSSRGSSAPICCGTISASRDVRSSRCASTSPPGCVAPKHSHPGEEIVYVIEGLLEYQLEGRPPVTLKAGEVLFIPAGTIHSAKNVGSGNAAELATYIVEKGKPLAVPG